MKPLAIQTLLDVHCFPYAKLISFGVSQCGDLLERDPRSPPPGETEKRHGYILTHRGRMMVQALTDLPSPKKRVIWYIDFSQEYSE